MPVPLLTAAAMRHADRATIGDFGISSLTLMESAGREVAFTIAEGFADEFDHPYVLILCGKGNNGGDGLVVARVLCEVGVHVAVVIMGERDTLTREAAHNVDCLYKLAEADPTLSLTVETYVDESTLETQTRPDIIVDALLGTGLTRDLDDPIRTVVAWINRQDAKVVAIDTPTGLDSDLGRIMGSCVAAELTIAISTLKTGLLVGEGAEYAGLVEVVDIGIPDFITREAANISGCAWMPEDQDIAAWLADLGVATHKYSAGMVLGLVGSKQYTGAAVLAANAALRIGAGYVIAGVPASIKEVVAKQLVEVAIDPLPETTNGTIAAGALAAVTHRLQKAKSLLVGCGIGRDAETMAVVRELLTSSQIRGVLDADGLAALVDNLDILHRPKGEEWILTPHWGEFERLVGKTSVDATDRVCLAAEYAARWGCILILKGLPSVVGCPDGRVFVNGTGNTGLATAGTGDVLAGFCAGLLAQGMPPDRAAISALHLGGAVADNFSRYGATRTMIATDLISGIPKALADITSVE